MAWKLLTQVYGLDPDRLYATYFEGDANVPPDTEARDRWLKYLAPHRVIASGAKDNFWEMGATGPCGPCSEIHFDRIGNRNAAHLVNKDDPNVLEIWNLVFIQFNRTEDALIPLPAKHVDTGMGLERLTSILQSKFSNYDTDAFQPLFDHIQRYSNAPIYSGKIGAADVHRIDTAYRVVADHARLLTVAISDGALPSNEGRGYVVRRVARRALRYAQDVLKAPPGLLSSLVPTVVESLSSGYPHLTSAVATDALREEEETFQTMLVKGVKYFSNVTADLQGAKLSGQHSFYLYDTLGFPIDLTCQMAREKNILVDVEAFEKLMEEQRDRSKTARLEHSARLAGAVIQLSTEQIAKLRDLGVPSTDDSHKYTAHTSTEFNAQILAVVTPQHITSHGSTFELVQGDIIGLILDSTPFYAESGGQVADTGEIAFGNRSVVVRDVQSYGGYVLHVCEVVDQVSNVLELPAPVTARVSVQTRRLTSVNHTITHVLNFALRKVLGGDIVQRGSLVDSSKLRFDFSYPRGVTTAQLTQVQDIVQSIIDHALPVFTQVTSLEAAKSVHGVRAIFDEQYAANVRLVSVGVSPLDVLENPKDQRWENYSVELCGGTHIANSSDAIAFRIASESAIAKGVRRIFAVTNSIALDMDATAAQLKRELTETEVLRDEDEALMTRAKELRLKLDTAALAQNDRESLKSRLEAVLKRGFAWQKKQTAERLKVAVEDAVSVVRGALNAPSGRNIVCVKLSPNTDEQVLRQVAVSLRGVDHDRPIFLATTVADGSQVACVGIVPSSQNHGGLSHNADEWIKTVVGAWGGAGGGSAVTAQGKAHAKGSVEDLFNIANQAWGTRA
eukprot:c14206_g1_i1.p1 GENE.c14206_g1_i1~~c14206_g1_i1.p1  ORF type:complete len:990 (+),score=232.21 c14206_g1_i1:437-2971(+)